MGMLNNPWFRVKIAKTVDPITEEVSLQFEHPTLAGTYVHIPLQQSTRHLSSLCIILNPSTVNNTRLTKKLT